MTLSIELIASVEELSEREIRTWNGLAANPFQRWEWLGSWWHCYKSKHMLHLLAVKRGGETIGFAPWYVENRLTTGRTIQFLGSGKACSDHLSLLVRPQETQEVCDAVAQWLVDASENDRNDLSKRPLWDAIELIGVDKTDQPINCLVQSMRRLGLTVEQTDGTGCYVIDLPSAWEDYIQMRSKSGRREIRQSLKSIDDGTIVVNRIGDETQLDEFWEQFVFLHQRRRHESGTTGCFDHPPFGQFLRTAASELLKAGLLEFVVASINGDPVAAQFAIVDDDCWYFYQSGMEPDAAHMRPGLSIFCHAIRRTIESGRTKFDMMRGDEPYKLRWRADVVPAQEIRVCSPNMTAQLRKQVYNAGMLVKNLAKSSLGLGLPQS